MGFKYSCADFTFPLLPHKNVLQLIKSMGFDGVDLGIFENRSHNYPSTIARNPQKEGRKLAGFLDDLQLDVSDVFVQTGAQPNIAATNSPDKSVRENNREIFSRMMEYTLKLGCKHMSGLPGVFHSGNSEKDDWERAREETIWRLEQAKDAGIVYAIEPHMGSIIPTPEATLRFVDDCPSLTITLDYGHFIYIGMSMEAVSPLIRLASHFHARGGAKDKLQTTVKENEIDYSTVVPLLKQADYSGYICMEYVYNDWGGCNRTDNVSETILLKQQFQRLEKK